MDDLQLITGLAPASELDEARRRRIEGRLTQRITAAEQKDLRRVARRTHPQRRLAGFAVAGAVLAAAIVAAFLTIGSPSGGPTQSAYAAVKQAGIVTAASARYSGSVTLRITHNGFLEGRMAVRWHDGDLSTSSQDQWHARSEDRFVGGMIYKRDATGTWVEAGRPDNTGRNSGTTPADYLSVVRADVGGDTLRSITKAMTKPTSQQSGDGSTVYKGSVPAGLIAPRTAFEDGQHIRFFPFGYQAQDEAANPDAPLNIAITVGADGIIRSLVVTWGTDASAWTYALRYKDLGSTAPIAAPENAKPLPQMTQGASAAPDKDQ
jgi:hypothetical protein